MTFVNSGIGAQIMLAPETTWGTAATTGFVPLEFTSETLESKKNIVQGLGLHAGGMYNRAQRRVLTYWDVSGGITFDLPTNYINGLLKLLVGSYGTTLSSLSGTTASGYTAVHQPGGPTGAYYGANATTKGASLTIQKGVPSVDGTSANPFTYVGMKPVDWTLDVATGAIATLQVNFNGANELAGTVGSTPATGNDGVNTTVPALQTWSEAATNSIFHFREAVLYANTGPTLTSTSGICALTSPTTLGLVRSAQVKQTFGYDTARYFLGGNGFKGEQLENNWRALSGQFVVDWSNTETMYQAYAADTGVAVLLKFTGPTSGSFTPSLSILLPQCRLEGEAPKVGGPGIVQTTVPFTGLDDGINPPIQITYVTSDTV